MFDSGKVLTYPKSGDWFLTNTYLEYCKQKNIEAKSNKLMHNFKKAYIHISKNHKITNESEELKVFSEFYTLLFSGIQELNNQAFIKACVDSKVLDPEKYIFYDDVKESIIELSKNYKLGIISDAWPSLINVYKCAAMYSYFNPFIISSIHGCTKEKNKLFEIALHEAKLKSNECLFIDDSLKNCKRARKLGFNVVLLNRDSLKINTKITQVKDMKELEKIIATIE